MANLFRLKPEDLSCIRAAHKTIASNPSQQFTIKDISTAVGINKNKLQHGFRTLYNMTFHECLLSVKVRQAEELLLNTDKPIKEIVSLTGFKSKTSLIKAFKKKNGSTPGAWKSVREEAVLMAYRDDLLNAG